MMNQVIRRRFDISSKWKSNLPKLIVVDGGKGQLNIVEKAINEKGLKNIDLISIAKGKKETLLMKNLLLKKKLLN